MKKVLVAIALVAGSMGVTEANDRARFNAKIGAHGGGFGFGPSLEFKVAPQFTVSAFTEGVALSVSVHSDPS